MNILDRFTRVVALLTGALLLSASLAVHADDLAEASKLFKQGQPSQAMDKVNDYLIDNPKDAQARFLKGLILTEQGKSGDAIKIFSALTNDYPDLPEPYNNLAVLYASQGQYDKAKMLLERAISTHPSYATAHENLGDIYAKMASQAYDRALQLDHGNATTQTKLAMIQNLFAGTARNSEPIAQGKPVPDKVEVPVASKVETAPVIAESSQPVPVQAAPAVLVAAPPALASKTEPVVASEPAVKQDQSAAIRQTILAWAAAWSSKNTGKYLSYYAADFKTPDGETRAAWEALRKDRVSSPKYIHVGVNIKSVLFTDSSHATVKMYQSYRASHFKTSGNKTLLMVKSGDKWLIQEERS